MSELIVDNFAGGGGASTGIEIAIGRSVDIAINHDPDAIAMHRVNHPGTKHYCESVWDVDPVEACGGRPVGLAWFSPDCKHFSKAKGGKPVSKKIRGLAWIVLRWAAKVRPRVIMLENVEEFQTWGPIKSGKPIKERSGETFRKWVGQLRGLGYAVEWRELRACDYGAPTIRRRLFVIARCDGRPIVWPEPTHGHPDTIEVQAGLLQPWRTAAEIIDWDRPCPSIFDRKKPLAENTMKRIARGIMKFVVNDPEPFIVKCNHTTNKGVYDCFRGQSINEPLQTITAVPGYGVVTPILTRFNQNGVGQPVTEPLDTVMAGATRFGVVAPMLVKYHGLKTDADVRGQPLDDPINTLDTSNRFALVSAFIAKHYDGGYQSAGAAATDPLPTVTTQDHNSLCVAHILQLNNNMDGQDMRKPLNTITAGAGHHGEVRAFLLKYTQGGNYGQHNGNKTPGGSGRDSNHSVGRDLQMCCSESARRDYDNISKKGGDQTEERLFGLEGVRKGAAIPLNSTQSGMECSGRGCAGEYGHQSQGREQAQQCIEQLRTGHEISQPETRGGNRLENSQERSDGVRSGCQGIQESRNDVCQHCAPNGDISNDRIQSCAFVTKYYGQGTGQSVDKPLDTVTANDRFGLVTIRGTQYAIVDIGMRMLEPRELFDAQGFPADYIIDRRADGKPITKSNQVQKCGNAVCPPLPAALVRANLPELCGEVAA